MISVSQILSRQFAAETNDVFGVVIVLAEGNPFGKFMSAWIWKIYRSHLSKDFATVHHENSAANKHEITPEKINVK